MMQNILLILAVTLANGCSLESRCSKWNTYYSCINFTQHAVFEVKYLDGSVGYASKPMGDWIDNGKIVYPIAWRNPRV